VDKEIDRKFKILFLCTGNSARSILAEFFLRRLDPKHFEVFSAGANPKGHVNPNVLELLRDSYHIDATSARSKSWEEFTSSSPSATEPGSHALSGRGSRSSRTGGPRILTPSKVRRAPKGGQEGRRRDLPTSRPLHVAADGESRPAAPRADDHGDREAIIR
jgi:Low molecular weight phosphotyrosine protein phosphatase